MGQSARGRREEMVRVLSFLLFLCSISAGDWAAMETHGLMLGAVEVMENAYEPR